MDKFINIVEGGLLHDLLALYASDLLADVHTPDHAQCITCSKQAIVVAITKYQELDALYRKQVR